MQSFPSSFQVSNTSEGSRKCEKKNKREDVRCLVEISDEPYWGLHLIVLKVLKQ